MPISKGEIPEQHCPAGSQPVTRAWLKSKVPPGALPFTESCLGAGPRAAQAILGLLTLPQTLLLAQWEAWLCQDLTLSIDGFTVTPQALHWSQLNVPRDARSHTPQPNCMCGGKTAFIFLPARLQRGCYSKWSNTYPGRKHCHSSEGCGASLSALPCPALSWQLWGRAIRAHCSSTLLAPSCAEGQWGPALAQWWGDGCQGALQRLLEVTGHIRNKRAVSP